MASSGLNPSVAFYHVNPLNLHNPNAIAIVVLVLVIVGLCLCCIACCVFNYYIGVPCMIKCLYTCGCQCQCLVSNNPEVQDEEFVNERVKRGISINELSSRTSSSDLKQSRSISVTNSRNNNFKQMMKKLSPNSRRRKQEEMANDLVQIEYPSKSSHVKSSIDIKYNSEVSTDLSHTNTNNNSKIHHNNSNNINKTTLLVKPILNDHLSESITHMSINYDNDDDDEDSPITPTGLENSNHNNKNINNSNNNNHKKVNFKTNKKTNLSPNGNNNSANNSRDTTPVIRAIRKNSQFNDLEPLHEDELLEDDDFGDTTPKNSDKMRHNSVTYYNKKNKLPKPHKRNISHTYTINHSYTSHLKEPTRNESPTNTVNQTTTYTSMYEPSGVGYNYGDLYDDYTLVSEKGIVTMNREESAISNKTVSPSNTSNKQQSPMTTLPKIVENPDSIM